MRKWLWTASSVLGMSSEWSRRRKAQNYETVVSVVDVGSSAMLIRIGS